MSETTPLERAAEAIGAALMRRPEQAAWLDQDVLRRQARAAFESIDVDALQDVLARVAYQQRVDAKIHDGLTYDDWHDELFALARPHAEAVKAHLLGGDR